MELYRRVEGRLHMLFTSVLDEVKVNFFLGAPHDFLGGIPPVPVG
jgi:hypothetical protein